MDNKIDATIYGNVAIVAKPIALTLKNDENKTSGIE